MSARRWGLLGMLCLAVGGAGIGRLAILETAERDAARSVSEGFDCSNEPELRAIRANGDLIRPLHPRKRPAQPGEWLDENFELGQSFHSYHSEDPNRPTDRLTTFYIQPLADFSPTQMRLVRATADLLGRWYGVPVKILDPIRLDPIPDHAQHVSSGHGGVQLLTGYLLDRLRERRPDDAVAVLALTPLDLWPDKPGWGHVIGQASLKDRVGVWSLFRMGDPETEYETCLRRTLKTAVHESGHMFGIPHCIAYECGMNGSNHKEEGDVRPMWFCADDEMKVWWAFGADPARRYEQLIAFADAHGLAPEARVWRASAGALRRTAEASLDRGRPPGITPSR